MKETRRRLIFVHQDASNRWDNVHLSLFHDLIYTTPTPRYLFLPILCWDVICIDGAAGRFPHKRKKYFIHGLLSGKFHQMALAINVQRVLFIRRQQHGVETLRTVINFQPRCDDGDHGAVKSAQK